MNIAKDLFFCQQNLFTLFAVTNKFQMTGDKHLKDITIRQMLAIPALIHAPDGKATINHIARSMGTTKQSAKQIVDSLERKGYLSVARSERDKRAVNITVTPEGQRAFMVCSQRTDEFLADIFSSFTSDELESLYTLLQKLCRSENPAHENHSIHADYNENASEEILRHHQNFAKLRNAENTKESE